MDDWVIISRFGKPIGAIGFLDGKAAVITSFYDDRDGNMDGEVSWGESIAFSLSPISYTGHRTVEVAMAARLELDVLTKDPSFQQVAADLFLNFASGLIADGIYTVYFSRGIKAAAKGVAGKLVTGTVKQFVVRKGMEKAVKKAYDASVGS